MSQPVPDDKPLPASGSAPGDDGTDGARSGIGAQTALLAMIRSRGKRASRDPEPEPPQPELRDPAAE